MMMYDLYRLYLLMILCKGFLNIYNFKILQAIHNDLIVDDVYQWHDDVYVLFHRHAIDVLNEYAVNFMLSDEYLMYVFVRRCSS